MKKKVLISISIVLVILIVASFLIINRYEISYLLKYSHETIRIDKSVNDLTIIDYNIRGFTKVDIGKKSWNYRAKFISKTLQEYQPSIICMQEVEKKQYEFYKNYLRGYNSVFAYRDNTNSSECLPIFFRTDMFTLEHSETFWLSDTPEEMSNTWNQYYYRICTIAVLKENKTGENFVIANTHLDYKNLTVQLKSIDLIKHKITSFNLPAVLMGDLNCRPESKVIEQLKQNYVDVDSGFDDELKGTFNNFNIDNSNYAKIDYMFSTKNDFNVLEYQIIDKMFNGNFASDHFPIYAKMELINKD